jgi:hypothetical protein
MSFLACLSSKEEICQISDGGIAPQLGQQSQKTPGRQGFSGSALDASRQRQARLALACM